MSKFDKFFDLVQAKAEKQDAQFFLSSGEGHEFETDEMEGENLSGWLIPIAEAAVFQKEWEAEKVSDTWYKYFVFAVWAKAQGKINVSFERS